MTYRSGRKAGRGSHASSEAEWNMRGVGNLTRAAYATAYSSSVRKTANLICRGEIRLCARVVKYPRGALSILVSTKVLSGASFKTGV